MRRHTILLALTAALLTLGAPAHAQADKNCDDFDTHDQAQAYFINAGGSPANNVDGLDRDRDGVACEGLPAPPDRGSAGDQPSGSDEPANNGDDPPAGQSLATTGAGNVPRSAGVGLLVAGLLLVAGTRYRGRHAR